MPITVSNTNTNININSSAQQTAQNFSELLPTSTVGPVQSSEISTSSTSNQVQAVVWQSVNEMTVDLQNAIINFINTDKDGNFIPNQNNQPRSKTITFEFQGSPSNVYKFGEIGTVSIFLGYPSLIISSNPITQQVTGTISAAGLANLANL
jgi:hypothetical protein